MTAELICWAWVWLLLALCDVYWENLMSVEVKGLVDTVRAAKDAIRKASDSAARLQSSAGRLTDTLADVEGMTKELDAATSELQGAVAAMSNGGPPLEGSPVLEPGSSASYGTPEGASRAVGIANRTR